VSRALVMGVISDTHGLLRPEALAALAGVDEIVHAGDIGDAAVLDGLRSLAPVTAVRGNVDQAVWARALPDNVVLERRGLRVLLLHDRQLLAPEAAAAYDVVITGHSHRVLNEVRDGVLHFNPGGAGPRRFRLPVTLGRLRFRARSVEPEIVTLI